MTDNTENTIEPIALKQASVTTSVRDLGEFTVKSNAIRFSDPCYNNDTWCKGSMPALNGQWQAKLGFFRDSYDEKSLKDGIAIQTKAHEIVKALTFSVKSELEILKNTLNEFVKEHKPKQIPYRQLNLTDLTKPIVDDIVKFSHDSIEPHSWRTPSESALSTLLDILDLILGVSHRIPDRWSYRIAMAEFQANKAENKTDEQRYEDAKTVLLETLNSGIEKSQKAFDEGCPRRTQFLHIKHESVVDFTPLDQEVWLENSAFDVGVDSGQAGFFDENWYAEYGNEKDDNNRSAKWEEIYSKLCDLTLGQYRIDPETGERAEYNYAGTFEFGCNGQTAHGDGSAPLYYRTDEDGNVIEAVYHYDIDWEEEDE